MFRVKRCDMKRYRPPMDVIKVLKIFNFGSIFSMRELNHDHDLCIEEFMESNLLSIILLFINFVPYCAR